MCFVSTNSWLNKSQISTFLQQFSNIIINLFRYHFLGMSRSSFPEITKSHMPILWLFSVDFQCPFHSIFMFPEKIHQLSRSRFHVETSTMSKTWNKTVFGAELSVKIFLFFFESNSNIQNSSLKKICYKIIDINVFLTLGPLFTSFTTTYINKIICKIGNNFDL